MWHDRCEWVCERLPLHASDELMGLDRRLVERHLIGCPACRDRLESLRDTLDVFQVAAECPEASVEGPSLWPALARQIQESGRPVAAISPWSWESWAPSWPRVATWSAAAAMVLAVFVTTQRPRPSDPPARSPIASAAIEPAPAPRPIETLAEAPLAVEPRAEAPPTRPPHRRKRGGLQSPWVTSSRIEAAPSVGVAPAAGLDYDLDRSIPFAEARGENQNQSSPSY